MEQDVTRIQVFVSCPGDVEEERTLVIEACERFNENFLQQGVKYHFASRFWKSIIGEFGPRPQGLINNRISAYDIYIGIFGLRFGTPTRANNPLTGNEYDSGTEEEFYLAYNRWQQDNNSLRIYVFFKNGVMPSTTNEKKQYKKLTAFKEKIMNGGWVNSFASPIDLLKAINTILFDKYLELTKGIRKDIKETVHSTRQLKQLMTKLSRNLPVVVKNYIPRQVVDTEDDSQTITSFFRSDPEKTVWDMFLETNRLVIVSNAGGGKSTELHYLGTRLKDQENYIPVYLKLNTYVNQDFDKFLPKGWHQVDESLLVLLLDGLDEIQPKYFDEATRKLQVFATEHPEIKIVVTCRINFYDLPGQTSNGLLADFKCVRLVDLTAENVKRFIDARHTFSGEDFIREAYNEGYYDMVLNPFFLQTLIAYYKDKGNLQANRSQIIERFIQQGIKLDKQHFKTTISIVNTQEKIFGLVERLAIAMEMMGRNYISDEEISKLIPTAARKYLKYFPNFKKSSQQSGQWQFAHNNVQEYIAAKKLKGVNLTRLKKILTFPPSHQKIRPSWVNTLSFLISILDDDKKRQQLTQWITMVNAEILVKCEKERIIDQIRFDVFTQIFNKYKLLGIWLHSNMFSVPELARFCQSDQAFSFLVGELETSTNDRVIKINALKVLEYFDFDDFTLEDKQTVQKIIFQLLESNQQDPDYVYSLLRALSEMKMNSPESIDKVLELFRQRKHQYIRAGLYKYLGDSGSVNDYADVFIEGLEMENKSGGEDRGAFSLADESHLLEKAIEKIVSPSGIKKLLAYFNAGGRKGYRSQMDRRLFAKVMQNCATAYRKDQSIFTEVFSYFILCGKMFEYEYAQQITAFFKATGTSAHALSLVIKTGDISDYEKTSLTSNLVDPELVPMLPTLLKNKQLTKTDILFIRDAVNNTLYNSDSDKTIKKRMNTILEKELRIRPPKIKTNKQVDFAKLAQRNFDILVSHHRFLNQIKRVFDEAGKENLTYNDIWDLRSKNNKSLEEVFPESVLHLVRLLLQHGGTVSFEQITSRWSNRQEADDYRISQIYHELLNKTYLKVSDAAFKFIQTWSDEAVATIDWNALVSRKDEDESGISINSKAEYLWFFVNRLKISLSKEHLLEFTRFKDFRNHSNENTPVEINQVMEWVSAREVRNKVAQNLQEGISVSWVWKSNCLFAIEHNMKDSYPTILDAITHSTVSEIARKEVLTAYFKKTGNAKQLKTLYSQVSIHDLGWTILDLLSAIPPEHAFVTEKLEYILENSAANSDKQDAAMRLIGFNVMSGLNYYIHHRRTTRKEGFDFSARNNFPKLTTTEAIPGLLDLIAIAKQEPYKNDHFNDIESNALEGLFNIGMNSEKNLKVVVAALQKFMSDHAADISGINFLHFNIDRLETQFYMKQSRAYNIDDVVKELRRFGLN